MNVKALNYWHGNKASEILSRDQYSCVFCKNKEDLVIDHIQPVKSGGNHSLENQRTLCRSCHSKLTATHENQTLSKIGRYLRIWRLSHPNYNKIKSKEFRKKHPGYAYKYHKNLSAIYRNAGGSVISN